MAADAAARSDIATLASNILGRGATVSTTRIRATRHIKKLGAVGVLTLAALAFPAVAQAHHAYVSASCTEAKFQYENFHFPGNAKWEVKVDDSVVASGVHKFNTVKSELRVPLTIYGKHTVKAKTWWEHKGMTYGASTTEYVVCAEAPAPPAPPAPAAPAPAAAAPAPAVAAPAPAATGVQGVQVSSPSPTRASLATRASCESKTVRATVNGRGMRRVTFSINGRVVRTVAVPSGRRTVSAVLRRRGNGVQALTVRVQYADRTQVMTARASRCAQAQVQPQFTG
jgi:hypothetical protein